MLKIIAVKVGGKAYTTKGLIETQFASKGPPPTIDNSLDHVMHFESRYSSIYDCCTGLMCVVCTGLFVTSHSTYHIMMYHASCPIFHYMHPFTHSHTHRHSLTTIPCQSLCAEILSVYH